MPNSLSRHLESLSPVAVVIISIAIMLLCGYLATRLTKRLRLPSVTGYILAGIVIGPYVLGLIPERVIEGTAFLPDIALAFIAFSTGEFFRLSVLKKNGIRVVWITLAESLTAAAAVFILTAAVLRLPLSFSIVLSALATATAPASTLMTIRQTRAKGDFVETLLQVVALDDIVGLLAYSIAIAVAVASLSGSAPGVGTIVFPLLKNIGTMLLGALFGLFMKWSIGRHSTDNRLIIAIALLFTFCGICALGEISPLLGCMTMGMTYINTSGDDRLFKQLNYFSPPLLLLFFVRSGVNFDLGSLTAGSASFGSSPLLLIGVLYFIVRIIGKYAGAFFGCTAAGKDRKVRDHLGLALIPQAGVAIGLAALGARTLGGAEGRALETIILASSVLYELIGPACAKLSLHLAGAYSDKIEEMVEVEDKKEDGTPVPPVELLIRRIRAIEAEHPAVTIDENEQAFTQAAEEHFAEMFRSRPGIGIRRRR